MTGTAEQGGATAGNISQRYEMSSSLINSANSPVAKGALIQELCCKMVFMEEGDLSSLKILNTLKVTNIVA